MWLRGRALHNMNEALNSTLKKGEAHLWHHMEGRNPEAVQPIELTQNQTWLVKKIKVNEMIPNEILLYS